MAHQYRLMKLDDFGIAPHSWAYVRGEEREQILSRLEGLAKQTGEQRAWGYVHHVLSGRHYDAGEMEKGYEEANAALACGENCNDWWIICQALNNIGVYQQMHENTITAFDYFWRIITRMNEVGMNDAALLTMAYGNISECMMSVCEYEKALEYIGLQQEQEKGLPEEFVHIPMYRAFTMSTELECLVALGRYQRAWEDILEWEQLERDHEETKVRHFALICWKYILLHQMEGAQAAAHIKEEILRFDILCDTFPSMKSLCRFLLEKKEDAFFLEAVSHFEKEAAAQKNTALQLYAVDLHLKYLQRVQDFEAYGKACVQFYQLQQRREEETFAVRSTSLHTIAEVAERAEQQREMERLHTLLQKKSEYDELTGLPNRYKLNAFCEEAFQQAYEQQRMLSVEILDIDCFKQLNDHYGHPEGDRCLKMIAEEIGRTLGEGELGARYGGDEFVIIRPGRGDAFIQERMETLRSNVSARRFPNELSTAAPFVTISQGAVNQIPQERDDLKAFLKLADDALYAGKKVSKNAVSFYSAGGIKRVKPQRLK